MTESVNAFSYVSPDEPTEASMPAGRASVLLKAVLQVETRHF